MFDEETRKEWPDSPHWVIEGKLEDHLVISVPVTTSRPMLEHIHNHLEAEFKRPVCVITHNMEFLITKRLPPAETAEVIKRIEEYADQRNRAFEKEAARIDAETEAIKKVAEIGTGDSAGGGESTDTIGEEVVDDGHRADSGGVGSGLGIDGGGGVAADENGDCVLRVAGD